MDVNDMNVNVFPNINILVSDMAGVRRACSEGASMIAEIAASIAPVESGAYVAGIRVEETKGGARVFGSDQKSHWVEFGTASQPGQFVFRQAAEIAGFKFRKKKAR